jgi:hypothetical protein
VAVTAGTAILMGACVAAGARLRPAWDAGRITWPPAPHGPASHSPVDGHRCAHRTDWSRTRGQRAASVEASWPSPICSGSSATRAAALSPGCRGCRRSAGCTQCAHSPTSSGASSRSSWAAPSPLAGSRLPCRPGATWAPECSPPGSDRPRRMVPWHRRRRWRAGCTADRSWDGPSASAHTRSSSAGWGRAWPTSSRTIRNSRRSSTAWAARGPSSMSSSPPGSDSSPSWPPPTRFRPPCGSAGRSRTVTPSSCCPPR